jgi:hypothetical protein
MIRCFRPLCGAAALAVTALLQPTFAHEITTDKTEGIPPSFDLLSATGALEGSVLAVSLTVAGTAGADVPEPVGGVPGAGVYAYVWPTTLDPAVAGFEPGSGILALAVTAHPDFDDTPQFDEDGDGDPANDGQTWHSHWVVLAEDAACGEPGLKVRDIAAGEDLAVPESHPDLPIMIDSPGYEPRLGGGELAVDAEIEAPAADADARFDAVTAALTVNAEGKAPLLCVTQVFDIASGDLSLPGSLRGE